MLFANSSPQRTSPLLKYLFGQHILNGLAVSLGIGLVVVAASTCVGFSDAMAVGTGAVCVSLGDNPGPLESKAHVLPLSLFLTILASLLIALTVVLPPIEGVMVVAISLVAGLLVGYGRWAQPLSVLTLFSVVLTLGSPIADVGQAWRHELLFLAGAGSYVLVALLLTWIFDASSRRLAIGECLREFAAYLRTVARFYETVPDLAVVYAQVVEQQAALVDHLQAARNLVFAGPRTRHGERLAEALAMLLDALDDLVSLHADHAPLHPGLVGTESSLIGTIRHLALALADDLDHLAVDLLAHQDHLRLPERTAELAALDAEVARLIALPNLAPRVARAVRATRAKLSWLTEHLGRLPAIMSPSVPLSGGALRNLDLEAFMQSAAISPRRLLPHLRRSSPVFRHAVRLGLAMGTAYLVTIFVPGFSHSHWILLTVAVVLRANHSATKQRRDDRLIGNLFGCLGTALLLRFAGDLTLMVVLLAAVGIAHAFTRVHYRVTATAACVMALLSLHFLAPAEAPPMMARLLDTVVGAAIAYLFSLLLPRWEYQDAPKLVRSLKSSLAGYAAQALRLDNSEQSFRLARKAFVDSLAAATESMTRMANEPERVRRATPNLMRFLAASYITAAQAVAVRLLLERRRGDLDRLRTERVLEETRAAVTELLDPAVVPVAQPTVGDIDDESLLDIDQALSLRCGELRLAAANLRDLAAEHLGG